MSKVSQQVKFNLKNPPYKELITNILNITKLAKLSEIYVFFCLITIDDTSMINSRLYNISYDLIKAGRLILVFRSSTISF